MEHDRIDSFGYPLCFPLSLTDRKADHIQVQARALGGHQKEAVVSSPLQEDRWRMVSDEGPGLGGTDLAPFPLGFWNAGLAADLLEQLMRMARLQGISIEELRLAAATDYAFSGSFFTGTGKGEAMSPRLGLSIASAAPGSVLDELACSALDASLVGALLRTPLENGFALHVNGRPQPLSRLRPVAGERAEVDPLKQWTARPAPGQGWQSDLSLIERMTPQPLPSAPNGSAPQSPPARVPGEARRMEIRVRGLAQAGPVHSRTEVYFDGLALSRFAIRAAVDSACREAPSGASLAMAGVAFCLMTQVLRYVEYRKLSLRGLRLVQNVPLTRDAAGRAQPLSTHVFAHGDEKSDVMEALLEMSANTCYLHAALRESLEPVLVVNGSVLGSRVTKGGGSMPT